MTVKKIQSTEYNLDSFLAEIVGKSNLFMNLEYFYTVPRDGLRYNTPILGMGINWNPLDRIFLQNGKWYGVISGYTELDIAS